jgi:hypothetical protein
VRFGDMQLMIDRETLKTLFVERDGAEAIQITIPDRICAVWWTDRSFTPSHDEPE